MITQRVFRLQRTPDHFDDGSAQEGVVVFALHQALEDVEIRLVDERLENHDDGHEELLFPVREAYRDVAVAGGRKSLHCGSKQQGE